MRQGAHFPQVFGSGGGTGGRETGRKGGGRCTGGGRRGGGKRDSQGGGKREKKGKITHHCAIFCNRKNAKGREPKNTGREPGLKGKGSGRFKPPCPPPLGKISSPCSLLPVILFQTGTWCKGSWLGSVGTHPLLSKAVC